MTSTLVYPLCLQGLRRKGPESKVTNLCDMNSHRQATIFITRVQKQPWSEQACVPILLPLEGAGAVQGLKFANLSFFFLAQLSLEREWKVSVLVLSPTSVL